ncbi:MAG TPA: hypothetical protein VHH15_01740 [Actinophytocola sp.]|nr:hypothetical protein [Actinophytocola sp.]
MDDAALDGTLSRNELSGSAGDVVREQHERRAQPVRVAVVAGGDGEVEPLRRTGP